MTPPKKRCRENRALPQRWRYRYGAYYYRVPPGQEDKWDGKSEFRLGKTEAEAYRTWSERIGPTAHQVSTMGQLLDRYLTEVVAGKAAKTRQSNRISIKRLRAAFAHIPVASIKPRHAYAYRDHVAKHHGKTSANRDIEVLRHSLSVAVEWGIIDRNPIKGQIKKLRTPPRTRLVTDDEIRAALTVATPMLSCYIRLKLMTGLRRGDILRLRVSDVRDDGIHVRPHKTAHTTGISLIITWDDAGELRSLIDEILAIPPRRIGDATLIATKHGRSYIKGDGSANGFDSLWQRFMARVLRDTPVTERFQERDLRAKVASDSGKSG